MAIEDRISESPSLTIPAKFTQTEGKRLQAMVQKLNDQGTKVTRSSLMRAIVCEYLDEHEDDA